VLSPTPTKTLTWTYTITQTPQATATAQVPAVLSTNIFRPGAGKPLTIAFKPLVAGHVTVRIFSLAGEHICKAFDNDVAAGAWI
jgi:hypothetical protein